MEKIHSPQEFYARQQEIAQGLAAPHKTLALCSTGCAAVGSLEVAKALEEEVRRRGLEESVRVKRTGCHGFCEQGPMVVVQPEGIFYGRVTPEDVPEIIEQTVVQGQIIERLLFEDAATGRRVRCEKDVPFYAKQKRVLMRNNSVIDPLVIEDYMALDGYSALVKALTKMTPDEVVSEIEECGLRGRGGGGFPSGVKWRICRNQPADRRYLICNADEGDPGAFMDRSLLEGTPHAVIEGMAIAAYAIGASHGIIYVRAEYPIAVRNSRVALDQARKAGLLGADILGAGFHFDISLREGAGAFVCGEETALIASLEGQRGMPRPRPPFPAQRGYLGRPTVINNVETLANVPAIILNGKDWFRSLGTEKSKGTKIFALAGKVRNTGLIEIPMGATLRQIVFDIGGGILNGRQFKAAQMGGPSGGCVPAQFLDLPIDYESVKQVGAIMGSGGLIVMDENTCMVDIARFFIEFVQKESCGKCVPCRVGTRHMFDILTRICAGQGRPGDIERLEELAHITQRASLCGLGQTAPNPVLSTLRYFSEEYRAHVDERRCPSKVCRALITYTIVAERCTGCMLCAGSCPEKAISGERNQPHVINPSLCIKCGLCADACRYQAIEVA